MIVELWLQRCAGAARAWKSRNGKVDTETQTSLKLEGRHTKMKKYI